MSRSEKFDWPLVTINILAYNRKKEVEITLTKILNELDYPKDKLEIIVVDNASTDGTYDMIKEKFPQVEVIRLQKNIGIAGWNCGFKEGKGKYFLLLDDDAYVEGGTLKEAILLLEKRSSIGILSFNVVSPDGSPWTLYFPFGVFSFWGCVVLIRKKLIESIGGFDSNIFLYAHEPDFVIRAFKHGFEHNVAINLVAYHNKLPHYKLKVDLDKNKMLQGLFSEIYTYSKHLHGIHFFKYIIDKLLWSFLLSIKTRNLSFIFVFVKAVIKGLSNKYLKNKPIENWIYDNDPRCVSKLKIAFLRKSGDLEKFYINFFRNRHLFFPDFREEFIFNERKKVNV